MGLWTMEDLGVDRALFFAPSLALVSQTVGEWTTHAAQPIEVICVCSDPDAGDLNAYELAVPVTTDPAKLCAQWDAPLETGRRRVIFSTYHSASVVRIALADSVASGAGLLVCDEAHRVAGDEDKAWQEVLNDSLIPARRRLFMTATAKLVSDDLKAAGVGASMDDEALFGRVAHQITFRDAINAGMLADYRIHVIGIPTNEKRVREMIRRRKFVVANDGSTFTPTLNGKKRPFDAGEVVQAIALEYNDRGLKIAAWLDEQRAILLGRGLPHERAAKLRAMPGWYEDAKEAEFDRVLQAAESGIAADTRLGARVTAYLRNQRRLYTRASSRMPGPNGSHDSRAGHGPPRKTETP